MTERLLVIRGGALGDFILGLPALQLLREAHPSAHLELIAPHATLPLAAHLADRLTPIERAEVASLFGPPEGISPELADRCRDLDLAIVWLGPMGETAKHNLEALGTKRLLWATTLPPEGGAVHASEHLIGTMSPIGIASPPTPIYPAIDPRLPAQEKAGREWESVGLRPESRAIAVHPGSGGRWKCWPAERFAEIVERLRGAGLSVVLIQGPADEEVVAQVAGRMTKRVPPVVAGLAVEQLAAFLGRCAVYLGNDSGVTHLAAAAGTPTVALFGPTDPAVWAPRGPRVAILRGDQASMDGITVDQVLDAVGAIAVR